MRSLAVESAGVGTWDYDLATHAFELDARCKELFGLAPGDRPLGHEECIAALHPDDRERARRAVRGALDPHGRGEHHIEYRSVGGPDGAGAERWLRAEGAARGPRGADELSLEVHNEGEPTPEELRPHIFGPYRMGPQTLQTAGKSFGLGLFIVCHVARAHGGRVDYESSREAGTTFFVRLPRRPPDR